MNFIAAGLAIVGSALGAAYGNSKVVSTTLESMARQPELSSELRSTMILGMAFIEAVPILGVVVALLLVLN
ncbi:F0F1 ATP synthase subunit C [Enterococcus aquimarinus]|uniref:ATP synthase subunit c n=1 Tax=Enterococcus aquimarinus TaxID=328396 RepID=A0A1L8QVI3_9ENTE|nr:F0F1 ATP synthase subunit C [Enterococcus aquimarinus]MBP6359249.1 F0F1 ATP synthase subunit C [Enterococcus sp.]MBP7086086.1 F0F1 ATP synthase subunit C [Enterococcus sp.]MBP7952877.1 F0F1 ATP synthase subunit C [Enterococcus sp.]MBP8693369.1 F0F1 ATP synthase subunit C [Enterococcus sp.]MBP9521260.1 F0F1 ATP synthase subunit C [Enterococcus sp.]